MGCPRPLAAAVLKTNSYQLLRFAHAHSREPQNLSSVGDLVRPERRVVLLGPLVPASLTFARSCKAHNVRPYLLEPGPGPGLWHRYARSWAAGATLGPAREGTPEGLAAIRRYVDAVTADALIAIGDESQHWLAVNRAVLEPRCLLLAPSVSSLEAVSSKDRQIRLALEAGFEVLPTWYLDAPAAVAAIPWSSFPLCLRPSCPAAVEPSFKVRVVQTPEALARILEGLRFVSAPLIAQPFKALPNLVVHGARTEAGRILTMAGFLATRKFEGMTLSLRRWRIPLAVEAACRSFVDAVRLAGCFHFELLCSPTDERAYFLEINARLGGTTDKVTRLGYDEPMLCLAAFGLLDADASRIAPSTSRGVVNKRTVVRHLISALAGKLSEIDYPPAGRIRSALRSLFELLVFKDSTFDWRDPWGSIRYQARRPRRWPP